MVFRGRSRKILLTIWIDREKNHEERQPSRLPSSTLCALEQNKGNPSPNIFFEISLNFFKKMEVLDQKYTE